MRWDGGETNFEWVCTSIFGSELVKEFSIPRNSEIYSASVQIQGAPYLKNEELGCQSVYWPKNPSMDLLRDGVVDWAFPGTLGMQTVFSGNATESDLSWDPSGQTRSLEFTLPRSTIRSASLTVTSTDYRKYSYEMDLDGTRVWSKDSLSFSYSGTSYTSDKLVSLTTGDVNGDGKAELVAGATNGKVYIAQNVEGQWVNATVVDLQIQSGVRDILGVALGMLDNTPGLDIVAACADGSVYYALNQGGIGNYSGANQLISGVTSQMTSVTVADANGDDRPDIVAGNLNGRFYVFLNGGTANFDSNNPDTFKVVPGGSGPMNAVAVYDINGDAYPDLLGANADRNFYIATGASIASTFKTARPVITPALNSLVSLTVEDVNRDGFKDLVGASLDGLVYICINLGGLGYDQGIFDTQPGHLIKIHCDTSSLRGAQVKDVNGDDAQDIIVLGTSGDGQVIVAINDGFGNFPLDQQIRPFSGGQSSRALAVDDMDRDDDQDIAIANGMQMEVWMSNQRGFVEVITGPGFVSALQDHVDNTMANVDRYGNPMITCRFQITNSDTGTLRFSQLAIDYSYSAMADFTDELSDYMNSTAGPYVEGELVRVPVIFKMESAGVLNVGGLYINSELALVPIIDFPTESGIVYERQPMTLIGHASHDPDGTRLNYTWTDIQNGPLLGYGSRRTYTPEATGNMTIELKVRDELLNREAARSVSFWVAKEPYAYLSVAKFSMSVSSPREGEKVTIKVTIKNTGIINATNVGFQLYLDTLQGAPIATGVIDSINVARTKSQEVTWTASNPGDHIIWVQIGQADQTFRNAIYGSDTFQVQATLGATGIPYGYAATGGGIAIGLGAAAVFLGASEAGKYLLFLMFLPSFSKKRPEDDMDRFIRGKILGYIRTNPGCHYNLMKRDLRLYNRTLIHHLDTLEKKGFIKSARDGFQRRFFPKDKKLPVGKFHMNPT